MLRRGLVLRTIVVASVSFACGTLKTADQASDAGASDGGDVDAPMTVTADGSVSDGAMPDGAVPDAGAPPADFECAEPWTMVTKTKAECAPRQVKDVEATAPLDTNGVSIAHTTTGRVGIVYNAEQDGQTGELHLAHFTPATATYAAAKIVIRSTGFAFHDGYLTKLATSAPDTLAVLSYDMDDGSQSGEIHLRKLLAGVEPLTDDLVVTAVKNPTEIAVASDPLGNTYATFRVSTGAPTAKLSSSKKTAAGAFAPLPDLTTALLPQEAPGVGGASLFVDPGGQVHLLFHYNEVAQHSTPRYHTLAGTTWSSTKTIDNAALDGLAGFSPRIAVFGTKKYAAYFFRMAGQAVPVTADLRLASWDSSMDFPTIEILDQQIPSPDPLAPVYRVAMGVDKYGLVHLAIIRPSPSTTVGFLEYRRQTRVAGGGTKWLSDIVDSDVLSDLAQAYVDMVIDENARPHIAYVSAKDGKVKYATRFDR
jgi:hypothetical protein